PREDEAANRRPSPARRIVQFRAHENVAVGISVKSSCDQYLAVGQQRRYVTIACGAEAAGGRPGPARRIVQFRARETGAIIKSSCYEDLAVSQQRRWVITAGGGDAASASLSPRRRIVDLSALETKDV